MGEGWLNTGSRRAAGSAISVCKLFTVEESGGMSWSRVRAPSRSGANRNSHPKSDSWKKKDAHPFRDSNCNPEIPHKKIHVTTQKLTVKTKSLFYRKHGLPWWSGQVGHWVLKKNPGNRKFSI